MRLLTNWKTIKAMPQLNKTGPMGQGSQTGRKQGKCCSENDVSLDFSPRGRGMRRGFKFSANQDSESAIDCGRGRGAGRGWGNRSRRGIDQGPNSQVQ